MRIPRLAMGTVAALLASAAAALALNEQERRDYTQWMLATLPNVPEWREWQQATGEIAPDFDALPRQNNLPYPLVFADGRAVKNPEDWKARRAEIMALLQKYQTGSIPPKPAIERIVPVSETQNEGSMTRVVRLEYGPGRQASTQVTLIIPDGEGPFPVLMGRSVPPIASRGYISCVFSGSVDQRTNLPELYPDHDFATMGQLAWTVQMVVDYLLTLPQVDKARIAICGYSRDGKMATIAAALDERIAAVIAGSTGVGGVLPWRLSGERNQGESIQSTTMMFPLWFHPRLRYFSGREDRLPIDANLLLALVAPRACLIEYGYNDEVSNTYGSEAVMRNVAPLYAMLGKPDGVGLLRLPGTHANGGAYAAIGMDWLDIQFGRSDAKWDNREIFPWNFEKWRAAQTQINLARLPVRKSGDVLLGTSGAPITTAAEWQNKAGEIRGQINWMLGDPEPVNATVATAIDPLANSPTPPAGFGGGRRGGRGGPGGPGGARGPAFELGSSLPQPISALVQRSSGELGWLAPQRNGVTVRTVTFGENLKGDLYLPANAAPDAKLPTVVWLHSYSYPLGYMWVYKRDLHPILTLTAAGYAVLAYDQAGFGARMGEYAPFYERYPKWSLLGKMVADAGAAVDALGKDSQVDASRIYLFGFSFGGTVGLYAAALDPRVAGVVAASGFTPMRTDTAERGMGGLARYSADRGIAPRLGLFIGREAQLQYDFEDVLAIIAPRPALVIQPKIDRDADPAEVRAAVAQARKVYTLLGAPDNLGLIEPADYNRLPAATQDEAVRWLAAHQPAPAAPAAPPSVAGTNTPAAGSP